MFTQTHMYGVYTELNNSYILTLFLYFLFTALTFFSLILLVIRTSYITIYITNYSGNLWNDMVEKHRAPNIKSSNDQKELMNSAFV